LLDLPALKRKYMSKEKQKRRKEKLERIRRKSFVKDNEEDIQQLEDTKKHSIGKGIIICS
jgi:hypothetical protein